MTQHRPNQYNTSLAAEFYVLSMLHRIGLDANLTLGNKKAVDIAIIRAEGDAYTVDVKGTSGSDTWLVGNVHARERHFVVLVAFLRKMADPTILPEVYVIPSMELCRTNNPLITVTPKGWRMVYAKTMRTHGKQFRDAWLLLS